MKTRISGAICGTMWMPESVGGFDTAFDLDSHRQRIVPHATIAETLESWLTNHGGDFHDARFTADTEIIFEYRKPTASGYVYHVRSYRFEDCESLKDLTDPDHYVTDFWPEN